MTDMTTDVDEDTLRAGDAVRLADIDWDTSGGEGDEPDLPETVELTLPADWEPGDSLADLLSDRHGFCINGIGTVERL